jgi:hypothetical protein
LPATASWLGSSAPQGEENRVPKLHIAYAAAALIAAIAVPAQGGEAQDRIFRTALLADVEIGQGLVFARDRGGAVAVGNALPIEGGTVEVTLVEGAGGARVAQVDMRAEGEPPSRAMLPADGGHPVMLLFLETTARAMADATGGSPFYIRNRIREALGADASLQPVEVVVAGDTIPAHAATFRPFVDDANRATMGPFADLALTMVLSDAVPGGFARFEAATEPPAGGEPAFKDTLAFERLEEN